MSLKKIPCDECRERKRRCTYDKPCQRCIKFGIPCIYTIKNSPADEEYLQQIKLLEQVDQLHGQLDSMQQEMISLQPSSTTEKSILLSPITEDIASPSTTISSLDSSSPSFSLGSSSPLLTYYSPDTRIIKRQRTNSGLEAILSQHDTQTEQQENSNWTLTVNKGNLIIRTDIKTHTELLDYLCKSVSAMEMNDIVPYSVNDLGSNRSDALSRILQVFVWKRYGKSRYKSITYGFFDKRHKKNRYHHDHNNGHNHNVNHDYNNSITMKDYTCIQQDSISSITLKLLHAYISCRHLHHIAIHVPTFLKLLVHPNVMESPAVLALCALSCTASCRHVVDVLPENQDVALYGEYYFDQARQLAMDRFDDPCLEIFATYVIMAYYKLMIHRVDNSRLYGDMAERISVILGEQLKAPRQHQQKMDSNRTMDVNGDNSNEDDDDDDDLWIGKQVLFQRLEMQLFKVLSVTHLMEHKKQAPNRHHEHPPPDRRILNLFHGASDVLTQAEGDSDQEKRHILLIGYIAQLNKECHNTAHQAPSEDTANYVGIVGHMVEMCMRRWYLAMPDSFRLNLPIFDAFSTTTNSNNKDDKSGWLMAMENAPDVIPLLTTMAAYNEYMMMVKAHICKTPDDKELRESLAAYWKENGGYIDHDFVQARWGKKWLFRLAKMEELLKVKLTANYYENKLNGIDDDDDDDNDNGDNDISGGGGGGGDQHLLKYRKKYDKVIITALLESGYAGFEDPAAHTSVKVALNAIQLLQFLRLRYPCHYDQRVALNVWDILIRATRFGFGDQEMKATIQANLLCCLVMIREEFEKIPYHGILVNYVDELEKEYDQQFNFM